MRAVVAGSSHAAERRSALIGAFLVASAYAVTDEWHQSFVEGRTASPIDWAVDTAGAAAAATLLRRSGRARRATA